MKVCCFEIKIINPNVKYVNNNNIKCISIIKEIIKGIESKIKSNQLYPTAAHSKVDRKFSVKALRSPFSAEFYRHYMLSGGTQ